MRSSNDDVWTLDEDPIHIETIEQLLARPRYVRAGDIDLATDPVRAVIGWYNPLSVECALPDGTPHLKGYLCRTVSGAEVCIGHICGSQYLGEEFQRMINVMNKRAELLRHRVSTPDENSTVLAAGNCTP